MRINGKTAAIFVLAAGLCVSTTVLAEEFKSKNGVMSIETLEDDWKVTEVENDMMSLTDGENVITMRHFSNGEKLPEITVADEEYEQVCQNIISTKNEVFIVTGLAADSEDFKEIQEAVQSVVINKYDTKKAVKKQEVNQNAEPEVNQQANQQSTPEEEENYSKGTDGEERSEEYTEEHSEEYTVKSAAFTGWVDGNQVNVRRSYSTDSEIIGKVYFQNVVTVTAEVKNSEGNVEWYQIDYDGEVGYVSAKYISHSPSTAESLGYVMTDEQKAIYRLDGKTGAYINKATNGNWYDGSGRQYVPEGDGYWTLTSDESTWTETDPHPETPADSAVDEVHIADEEALNFGTLYLGEDGIWRNIAYGVFTDNGDGTFTGMDGTIWYTVDK